MASSYLFVEVANADVPSSSNATSSYYVKLSFNGRSVDTETKEKPVWNQKIRFAMRDDYDYHHPSGGLNLQAAVYSVDQMSSLDSLLGIAVVDSKHFVSHSSKAQLFAHDLIPMKSCRSDDLEVSSLGPVAGVNGKLNLRVFHSAADDQALFENDDDSSRAHQTEDGADNENEIFNFLFSRRDHLFGEEDKQTSAVGSTRASSSNEKNSSASSRALTSDEVNLERGKVVERMEFLFVVVVKARGLPDVDAAGLLDPFVEVNFGAYHKRFTTFLKGNANPEWNKTFAFSLQSGNITRVDVFVKDSDLLRDDIVGKLYFYLDDIPRRNPDDAQPEPTWHPLLDQDGNTLGKASLLLAIWKGSQADEAYRHAWESPYGPKVYENPRLWFLRVTIVEVQGVVACDVEDEAADGTRARPLKDKLFCKVCLGDQVQKTRPGAKTMQTTSSGSYVWREEDLVFIAAQPFFESNLQVDVVAASSFGSQDQQEEVIGQLTIPLAEIQTYGPLGTQAPQWSDLKKPQPHSLDAGSVVDQGVVFGGNVSHMRIRLRTQLDGGYHIGHDPQGYLDDTRPAERQLWEPPIGRLHLGILRATGLRRHIDGDTGGLKPYCVAKYGDKWVRTRTIIESSDPVFNEQYTWDVYDTATVLNVGVFDHCTFRAHHRIGKVRIRLSTLETDRIYAHAYSLVTLSPSGPIKTGELRLALKISLPSTTDMLRMYARPTLPRKHYVQPLKEEQEDFFATVGSSDTNGKLWSQAAKILEFRLERIEPPLRKEVVAYMCNVESSNNNSFSMRRSKANFYRLAALASPVIASLRWFEGVRSSRSWMNHVYDILVHAIFVLALCFHGLVLPLVLVCVALVGVWNYIFKPQSPTYLDLRLSCPDTVHLDELDEEFDTINNPCPRNDDVVRMRYDRLRSVASSFQTITGDVATQLERIQSLLSWSDPRATVIFMLSLLIAAAVVSFVPYKLIVAVAGFYIMRPPWLRTKTPSIFLNFFRRLPTKQDILLM